MPARYSGPLRDEPLAVELHNTVYAAGGELADGLAEPASMRAWLAALATRLPDGGPSYDELAGLRDAVRTALHAAIEDVGCDPAALDAINRASARAPSSPRLIWRPGAEPVAGTDRHGA